MVESCSPSPKPKQLYVATPELQSVTLGTVDSKRVLGYVMVSLFLGEVFLIMQASMFGIWRHMFGFGGAARVRSLGQFSSLVT